MPCHSRKGKEGACARRRVAAGLISVSLPIPLQGLSIHAYLHVTPARLSPVQNHTQAPVFPARAVLTVHIGAMSGDAVILVEGI